MPKRIHFINKIQLPFSFIFSKDENYLPGQESSNVFALDNLGPALDFGTTALLRVGAKNLMVEYSGLTFPDGWYDWEDVSLDMISAMSLIVVDLIFGKSEPFKSSKNDTIFVDDQYGSKHVGVNDEL